MIKGIGNDIVEIERISKVIDNSRFIDKYFSEKEKELFINRKMNPEILAGNFAVKEAVSKVFGTGVRNFNLIDIEVLRDELGKPYVILSNGAKNIADSIGIDKIFVSISHCEKYAVGFAIGEGV